MRLTGPQASALLQGVSDAVLILDRVGRVVEVAPRFCALAGWSRDECLGMAAPHPWWPDEPAGRPHARREARLVRRDGGAVDVRVSDRPVVGEDGSPIGVVRVVTDLRGRRALLDRARRAEALAAEQSALRRIALAGLRAADEEAFLREATGEVARLFRANPAAIHRLEPGGPRLLTVHGRAGREGGRGLEPADSPVPRVARDGRRALGERAAAAPIRVEGRLWGVLAVELLALPAGIEARLERFGEAIGDALPAIAERERLAAQAVTDSLTGLANHRAFHERLVEEVARAQRHGRSLSLCLLDLDHFKGVNDLYGHQAGDQALCDVAERLLRVVRSTDLLARVGGEEFAWMLPETDDLSAFEAAERARRLVAAEPPAGVGHLTLSAGICDLRFASGPTELVRLADQALYLAKSRGRDMVCLHRPAEEGDPSLGEAAGNGKRDREMAALRTLARLAEARGPAAPGHSERVGGLAARIAIELDWPAEMVAAVREAAALHNLGRIDAGRGARDPGDGALATLASEMAADALTLDQRAWIRSSRERFDGCGVPDGLHGEAIPEGARIIAVANAWDLLSNPAEGPAPPPAQILAELRGEAGARLCPRSLAALERVAPPLATPARQP